MPAKSKQALQKKKANQKIYQERRRRKLGIQPRAARSSKRCSDVIKEEKLARGKCLTCERICDHTNWMAFDFDHRDPRTKEFNISSKTTGLARLRIEMTKCDLLCAYCHRLRTHHEKHHDLQFEEREQIPTLFDHE